MGESAAGGSQDGFFVLAKALRAFKAGPLADNPSDRALARAAGVSPTTIADWLRGTRFPQDIGTVLIVVRKVGAAAAARGVAGPAGLLDEDRWRAAYQEEARRRAGAVSDAVQRAQAVSVLAGHPAGVRAGEADLRRLGVHEAISVPGTAAGALPEYVPRDADAARAGVRARVAAAAERGGFVLLVGGSSVGKTRCAAEAIRALVPDWQLVHPAGPAEVAALAAGPPPRTVVWLDELQRYLGGEHGLTGGVVRALLGAPGPVMLIGTLWPDLYSTWTAVRAPGRADPHAREREVLGLADVVRIAPVFSPREQDRARAAAGRDPQLRAALAAGGYGLTQTLAAAPQLVARWEDAREAAPYAWAVLTAALDAARLGARAPLTAGFLRAAAPGYCTSAQQAEAPGNWFEQALAYATTKLHGAAAALAPAGAGMGQVTGYTVADYLDQHGRAQRVSQIPPPEFWAAAAVHATSGEQVALAEAADIRGLYRPAAQLLKNAAAHGNCDAANRLLLLHGPDSADPRPARWAASHAALDDPSGVASLLRGLSETSGQQVDVLLARNPAGHVSLDCQFGPGDLLGALLDAGAQQQVDVLLARNPAAHIPLDSPTGVRKLLDRLRQAGAQQQVDTLLARYPAARDTNRLREATSTELIRRLASTEPPPRLSQVHGRQLGRIDLDSDEQLADLAGHAPLSNLDNVVQLLEFLRKAAARRPGAQQHVEVFLARNPAGHVLLNDPAGVTRLLDGLREAGAQQQIDVLLGRDPVGHVVLDHWAESLMLLISLRNAGAREQAAALHARLPAAGMFEAYFYAMEEEERLRFRFGRQADGTPAPPWDWDDLD